MESSSNNVYTVVTHRRRKPRSWKTGVLTHLPYPQTFALPKPFISYFMESGVTKAQRKLLHSCQYFFLQKRFYPFEYALFDLRKMKDHVDCCDETDKKDWIPEKHHRFNFLNAPFKISINHKLCFYHNDAPPELASQLLRKVYKCNLTILCLHHQHIRYKEYLLLTEAKKLRGLIFNMNVVTYDNGDIVPFEYILKEIPNVYSLHYVFPFDDISKTAVTENSMRNILKLPTFKNLTVARFYDMPRIINPQEFAQFVLQQQRKCSYKLWYVMTQDDGVIDSFNKAFNIVIKSWKIKKTKPKLFVGKSSTWVKD